MATTKKGNRTEYKNFVNDKDNGLSYSRIKPKKIQAIIYKLDEKINRLNEQKKDIDKDLKPFGSIENLNDLFNALDDEKISVIENLKENHPIFGKMLTAEKKVGKTTTPAALDMQSTAFMKAKEVKDAFTNNKDCEDKIKKLNDYKAIATKDKNLLKTVITSSVVVLTLAVVTSLAAPLGLQNKSIKDNEIMQKSAQTEMLKQSGSAYAQTTEALENATGSKFKGVDFTNISFEKDSEGKLINAINVTASATNITGTTAVENNLTIKFVGGENINAAQFNEKAASLIFSTKTITEIKDEFGNIIKSENIDKTAEEIEESKATAKNSFNSLFGSVDEKTNTKVKALAKIDSVEVRKEIVKTESNKATLDAMLEKVVNANEKLKTKLAIKEGEQTLLDIIKQNETYSISYGKISEEVTKNKGTSGNTTAIYTSKFNISIVINTKTATTSIPQSDILTLEVETSSTSRLSPENISSNVFGGIFAEGYEFGKSTEIKFIQNGTESTLKATTTAPTDSIKHNINSYLGRNAISPEFNEESKKTLAPKAPVQAPEKEQA